MPRDTPVHRMFEALKRKGASVGSAVRIAQARTGAALITGKKPKPKK